MSKTVSTIITALILTSLISADVSSECLPAQDYQESKVPDGYSRSPAECLNTICVSESLYLLLHDFCEIKKAAEAFSIGPSRYYVRSIDDVMLNIVKVMVATEKSGMIHGSGAYLLIEKQGGKLGQAKDAPGDYQEGKWVIIRKQMWQA